MNKEFERIKVCFFVNSGGAFVCFVEVIHLFFFGGLFFVQVEHVQGHQGQRRD